MLQKHQLQWAGGSHAFILQSSNSSKGVRGNAQRCNVQFCNITVIATGYFPANTALAQ